MIETRSVSNKVKVVANLSSAQKKVANLSIIHYHPRSL